MRVSWIAFLVICGACTRTPATDDDGAAPSAGRVVAPPADKPAPAKPAPANQDPAVPIDPKIDLPELTVKGDAGCAKLSSGRATLDVVSGRIKLDAPRGASDIPRSYDLMGAPEPTVHESRVILEKGNQKLVIHARELFQTAPADLGAASIGYFTAYHRRGKDEFEIGKLPVADKDVRVAVARPLELKADESGEAILLLAAVVRTADNTLLAVDYYVNPAVGKATASCQRYAIELVRSVRSGRALDVAGGRRELPAGPHKLDVDLPAGYVSTTQDGPDFQVHYLRKLAPLGGYPGHLVIYVGGHPDRTVPTGTGTAVDRKGKLIGVATQWQGWRSDRSGVIQATVPVKDDGYLQLQVVQVASLDGGYLDELDRIASTIRVR